MPGSVEPSLVPELLVTDLDASLAFWRGRCGFRVRYGRPEERFAYLVRDGSHVMLDQIGIGRDWLTGPLERPLGRGVNLQIAVDDAAALAARFPDPFLPLERREYRTGATRVVVQQFAVLDPDGYLLRFQSRG